ncbi:hypothetical protein LJC51_09105 [Lachnospiraceae bacterium OttesenSCG-928-J05]|nr:hypothetical protein [Lachnospiraceae bacterium OttesenSCG-928-J05]
MKQLMKYHIKDTYLGALFFIVIYTIINFAAFTTISVLVMKVDGTEVKGNVGGFEMAYLICIFVIFVASYGENLRFFTQYSFTRKQVIKSTFLTVALISLTFSLATFITTAINNALIHDEKFQFMTYLSELYGAQSSLANNGLVTIIFWFALFSVFAMFGLFLAILFVRANKYGRVLIAAGTPVLIFLVFPILIGSIKPLQTLLSNALYILGGFRTHNPLIGALSLLVCSGILGALSYLVNRRTEVK